MKKVISSGKIPVKMWLEDVEENALKQAINLSNLPFAFKHIALMPDCHAGYGMPIGGVLATEDVIVPNAVGVDIGCGMVAVKSNLNQYSKEDIKTVMGLIRKRIPVGFNHHKTKQDWVGFESSNVPDIKIIKDELESAKYQLGTLGGGNHFQELQVDENGYLWMMIHSGSRNFGLKIAKEYHERAKKHCEMWYSSIPDNELSFLPASTQDAKEYLECMNYALAFAKESRDKMVKNIMLSLSEVFKDIKFENPINVHHNYAQKENHYNRNVIVHRKGATSARCGELGIIPGSQGTNSYIVKGLGNPESFMSCSHGAGRKMGRKQAQKELNLSDEIKKLDELGVIHGIRSESDLDEAAGAYKNIDVVMENQNDLVEIVTKLKPVAVIKG